MGIISAYPNPTLAWYVNLVISMINQMRFVLNAKHNVLIVRTQLNVMHALLGSQDLYVDVVIQVKHLI